MSAKLHIIVATVQQLLTQTTALLQENGAVVVQDENLEILERDVRQAMMHLRRCRNESPCIPVNQLPPELLCMIFGHLRPPPYIRGARYLTPLIKFASYKPLITAMLVCHKWYSIASHAASLWTDIDFQRRRTFAPVLLARSLGAAIHLCGHITSEDDTFATAIKDNGARIRELDLWAGDSEHALQSILAVDMPRLRLLCLSCESENATRASTVLICAAASFPALEAMLLESFLFVPAHVLPHLTHLHLAKLERVNATNVLDLLRNTPALEVLDIGSSSFIVSPNSTAVPSSVSLPRLQSSCLFRLASTVVSYLMTALEVPSLAYLDLSTVFATGRALQSTPLLPEALTTRTMRRLALDVDSDFASFRAKLHGSGILLKVDLSTSGIPDEERPQWAVAFRGMLPPLSAIEECHFQASQWAAPYDILPHLAAYLPAVSTLLIKHDMIDDDGDEEDGVGHMALARTVARVLESDDPVLFPHLMHLEFVVACIPREFCKVLARALAHRAAAGRRLQKLRIRVDDEYIFQWKLKWMDGGRKLDLTKTGIFDHVDVCEISDDFVDDDNDAQRFGWGSWKDDCVQRTTHEYWRG